MFTPIELFSPQMMEEFLHSCIDAGRILMTTFWSIGQYFLSPMYVHLQNTQPGIYVYLKALDEATSVAFENLPSWFPVPQFLENGLLDFTYFDVLLFGVGVVIIVKVLRTIWDALPIV